MEKYILIGIPGSGKSTLGQRVAAMLDMPFYDTDEMVRGKIGLVNPFLVASQRRFLDEQRKTMAELAILETSAIIATGAEIALIPECAEYMKNAGKIIHIKRRVDVVLESLRNGDKPRSVLRSDDGSVEIPMQEKTVELYSRELPQYDRLADFVLENNGNEAEGATSLIALINEIRRRNNS
jgi:shikimate kinase